MSKSSSAEAIENYHAIRVGSIAGRRPTTFDTYIRVGDRFVLYCRKGDTMDGERLDRLKSKNIPFLYIPEGERLDYQVYLQQNIDAAYNASNDNIDYRALVVTYYNTDLVEGLFKELDSFELYEEAKSSAHQMVEFICNVEGALKAMMMLKCEDGNIAQHGVRVAALAIALANEMKLIDNNRPVHLMALGAFVHDVGHFLAKFDNKRPFTSLSAEDLLHYRLHPMDGAKRILNIEHYEPLVKQVVLQHEEHIDGSGFPKGLKADDMDQLSVVAAVANAYDRNVTFEGQTFKEALKTILIDKMGALPLPLLQGLQRVLKRTGVVAG